MATQNATFQEIGVVIDADSVLLGPALTTSEGTYQEYGNVKKGDKVYFDSWLAAKFPKGTTESEGFYWLVKWEDVRAIEHETVPK